MENSPILNDPYQEPDRYYATDDNGALNYDDIRPGRRPFIEEIPSIPVGQTEQSLFDVSETQSGYQLHMINLIREEVKKWREDAYPSVTRVTLDLLRHWFLNPDRQVHKNLFFAQREAIETAIWFKEVAPKSNAGQNILDKLRKAQKEPSEDPADQLPRIAFKMATGTGKTVVMGALLIYHYLNRNEYRQDTRFADYFLIVAPGITIRDRLGVLKVDTRSKKQERTDYYVERELVPDRYEKVLGGLNHKLTITNYHAFMPRALQGNKKSPMDGKLRYNEKGELEKQKGLENFNQVIARVMGSFKKGRRLLVLNDEAHHCYLPRSKGKTKDNEDVDENKKAAVWFSGLREIGQRFKLTGVYDLSATPYYLNGSGYTPYSLFPWVVSDFGLIEAIESGLVKIPYLPEKDDSQDITTAKLKHLYDHAQQELPKKGRTKKRSEARKEGKTYTELPPDLPNLVKNAFDQFYQHYESYDQNLRGKGEANSDLFTRPPVFIAVCNNTAVSKEVYKFIAGYEYEDEAGNRFVQEGNFPLLNNYDEYDRLKKKAPTLLIDSEALEDAEQVNPDFKRVFAQEIETFKRDYARQYGPGSADRISDADILREVVNTVGEPGKLGGHIRCVVSVSMLTEGWDANTVTHVAGLRKFGSQLLCEQVAGRALRRRSYYLQGYDKEGQPTKDKRKIVKYKFPPEYAHIIGVPFNMFKGGQTTIAETPEMTRVFALPERHHLEIRFPQLTGYRMEIPNADLQYDFSHLPPYEIDGSKYPMKTVMSTAFSNQEEELLVESVLNKRDQEIIYQITKELLNQKFSDDQRAPQYQFFHKLKQIVEEWYYTRLKVLNRDDDPHRRLVYYENMSVVTDEINKAINPHFNTTEYVRPVFRRGDEKMGSTRYVNGQSSKDCIDTEKSHVNKVIMDSDWEGVCAKTLEELDTVECYVKNQFLGFTIPYVKDGKDHQYYTDFLVRLKGSDGQRANLMIEVTGMNKDKDKKKWYVENRWLPAVNAVRHQYGYDEWHFIEIANEIRDIRTQLKDKIQSILNQTAPV